AEYRHETETAEYRTVAAPGGIRDRDERRQGDADGPLRERRERRADRRHREPLAGSSCEHQQPRRQDERQPGGERHVDASARRRTRPFERRREDERRGKRGGP